MRTGRERRSGADAGVKLGLARGGLILVVLACAALVAVAWWSASGPRSAGSAMPDAPVAPLRPASGPAVAEAPPAPARAGTDAAGPPDDPLRFEGRGRIRGELVLQGVDAPAAWTLVVEPATGLVGASRAESRRIAIERGLAFEAADLPLAGYTVRAEVVGLNSSRASVLLVRGASDVHVTLSLSRAGFVDGFVFDHRGAPAEGLRVTIENAATRARTDARVDAAGTFELRDVVDGEYRIAFGDFESPLVPHGTFTFRAPTLRWRETHLPPTGAARVRVTDAGGGAQFEADVTGSATPRGVLRGRTGADGTLEVLHLLPGRYALEARTGDGRSGSGVVEVAADASAECAIVVR